MNKRTLGIIVGAVLLIVGFLYLTKPKPAATTTSAKPSSHIEGKGSSGVTLVEYGDYQCPACSAYHPIVKNIVTTYGDRIFFQFRNYPLEALHQNARAGSRAAEAASIQGKFWEMHNALYENQQTWGTAGDPLSFFSGYAKQAGVADLTKFATDYKSKAVNDIINADMKEGAVFKITGTPTFVLDGKKIDNPRDAEAFNKVIDEAIAKKTPSN